MKNIFITCCLFLSMTNNIYSQTTASTTISFNVSPITLIGLTNTSLALDFNTPPTPGSPIALSNSSTWLNYTVSTPTSNTTKKITVRSSLTFPGVDLKLTVGTATNGAGTLGTPKEPVTLSLLNQVIIDNIKGSYTGVGINNGHQISITPEIENYNQIKYLTLFYIITYTISDD